MLASRYLAWMAAACAAGSLAAQPQLVGPYGASSTPLTTYVPAPGQAAGMLLTARINGGPPLRMLLDSGADDVTLGKRAAGRSGLSATRDFTLICPGDFANRQVKTGLARTIEVGGLSFRNYPVLVTTSQLPDGLDGVMPLAFFRGFLVRLDFRNKRLNLEPYPDQPVSDQGYLHALRGANLLFLPATFNRLKDGYVLLDTGAGYSAVSHTTAKSLRSVYVSRADLRGGNGEVESSFLRPGVRFQFAGSEVLADPVVAMDLEVMSRYNGLEIDGVLGYPELHTQTLTVNYRDQLVKLTESR